MSFWNSPALNSRTDRQRVKLPEMIFGYFLGPLLVLSMTCEIIAHGILIAVLLFLNVEKNIEAEQKLIAERKAKA